MEFIEYSKCTTCKRAKQYLRENNIEFIDREIKDKTPTKEEINNWTRKYKIEINKLFNTSGLIYRNLNLKDKLKELTNEEKIEYLSKNAMLIKRPILVDDNKILIGFKQTEWDNYFKEQK